MENPDFYRKCLCYEELDWQVSTFHQLLDTMMMRHKNIWHRCDKHKAVETMKNILLLLTIFNIYSCKICWKECTNVNVVKVSVSGWNILNLRFVYIECRCDWVQEEVHLSSPARLPLWWWQRSPLYSGARRHCLPGRGLDEPRPGQHDPVHGLGVLDRAALGGDGDRGVSLPWCWSGMQTKCSGKWSNLPAKQVYPFSH